MTLPYWLAFKLAPWLTRHVIADDPYDADEIPPQPSPRIVASQRIQPVGLDGEDAVNVLNGAFPDGRFAIERHTVWHDTGLSTPAWLVGVRVGREYHAAYVEGSAMDCVREVLLLVDAGAVRERAESSVDGMCS